MPVDLNLPVPGQSPNWANQLNTEIEKINQSMNQGVYFTSDYGVVGDGVADDTGSVQDLIDSVPDGSTVVAPVGSIFRTRGWTVVGKSITLDFSNAHLVKTSSSPIFAATGGWDTPVSVGGVTSGPTGSVLTVADTSGFAVGDLVKVFSDNLIRDARQREGEHYRQGQFVTVSSITGTDIRVTPRLVDTYDLNVRVARIQNHRVDFRFGTADFDAAAGGGAGAAFRRPMFQFTSLRSPSLDGHVLRQPGGTVRFTSCFAQRADIQVDDAPEADGYGVDDAGSVFGDYHIIMRRGRHAFTDNPASPGTAAGDSDPGKYGRSMWATIRGKSMGLMQAHWDTHHGGYGHKFIGITATGSPTSGVPGFSLRGQRHELVGCTAVGLSVGFRFHGEEDAGWATCVRNTMVGCVTREVSQAILVDIPATRVSATIPTVTIDGGMFETNGSTPMYIRRGNVYVNDPVFQIGDWTSSFTAPFILASSWLIGSMKVLNAVGVLGSDALINAANSSSDLSRVDLDLYYLSSRTDGDGFAGVMRANNAVVSLRVRSARALPVPSLVGVTTPAGSASATVSTIEGDASSSAGIRQTVAAGALVSLGRSADPVVFISLAASTSRSVSGVAAAAFGGQFVILSNTEGGSGTITVPASGTNLDLGADVVLAPGQSVTLAWNVSRTTPAWVRAS